MPALFSGVPTEAAGGKHSQPITPADTRRRPRHAAASAAPFGGNRALDCSLPGRGDPLALFEQLFGAVQCASTLCVVNCAIFKSTLIKWSSSKFLLPAKKDIVN